MVDTFIYDNVFHIIAGLVVIVYSKQITTSTKNLSGVGYLQKVSNPRVFKIVGGLWLLYGIATFVIPLFF